MPLFQFRVSEIEKDEQGHESLSVDGPCFEEKIEAENNSEAIDRGIAKFLAEKPEANLDRFVFGAFKATRES